MSPHVVLSPVGAAVVDQNNLVVFTVMVHSGLEGVETVLEKFLLVP